MKEQLEKIKQEALKTLSEITDEANLADWENKIFGRKNGVLTESMKGLKDLAEDVRKEVGQWANEVKKELEEKLAEKQAAIQSHSWQSAQTGEQIDITAPALPKMFSGHLHPATQVRREIEGIFHSMGFTLLDGPELESDYYNFTAVNIPATHPARDMQDTFYIKGHGQFSDSPWVMRTHTSSMEVRALQKYGAPLRIIVPGRCFRNEATDARHEHTFDQLEGMVVGEGINFSHLRGVLEAVVKKIFGPDTALRFRPKYYPFVEPGVNGEVTCFLCQGKGCRVCKQTGWMEVVGAGMTHPNVLREGGVDPNKYRGFAFGFGLTRLVMLKYGITDVRLLMGNDTRFLRQF